MRILLLSSSTGGGHDMRSRSFQSWAKEAETKAFDAQITPFQALEETHWINKIGVEIYNMIQKTMPRLHHIYFNLLECFHTSGSEKRLMGRKKFESILRALNPDVILSVHDHLNHGFFEAARNILSPKRIACITYCGEFFGGYGFSRHWVNPKADLFIGAVQETCDAAVKLGMPQEKTFQGGFMIAPHFYRSARGALGFQEIEKDSNSEINRALTEKERLLFLERDLGLNPNTFTLILGTGANGANNHLKLIQMIYAFSLRPQIIALCGKNDSVRFDLEHWVKRHSDLRVIALPHVTEMYKVLSCASAIFARPGTGTTSESIYAHCPIIFNGIGGIMPQERITVKFFQKRAIAHVVSRPSQLIPILDRFMQDQEYLKKMKEVLKSMIPHHAPPDIFRKIHQVFINVQG